MKITIIGLGEIGFNTMKEINNVITCYGMDINEDRVTELKKLGYNVSKEITKSDIYIISVYTTNQVLEVIKSLDCSNNPLIVIESTVLPGTCKIIQNWKEKNKLKFDLAIFPHRFNPNDKDHYVFNLKRVLGCSATVRKRILDFYTIFMDKNDIYLTTFQIAELCKPLENAYRFLEITIAEEIQMLCDRHNIDFRELRKAINTKWNIDLKTALYGVNGKCLPKDIRLISNYFKENIIFNVGINLDATYKKYLKEIQ